LRLAEKITRWLEEALEVKGGIGLKVAFVFGYNGSLRVAELVSVCFDDSNAPGQQSAQVSIFQ
jgi:hypothetical protein